MEKKQKEIRKFIATDLETRTEENSNERIISGYINKFNSRSQYMGFYEEVAKGAFDKTLADGHNIYAMYNHNSDMILGSTRSGSLRLNVDNIGLHFELRINPNISYASDIAELVKSGDLEGCSFGFWVTDDEWTYTEDKIDLRIIKELELIEVTITPFPAYLDSEASCRSFELHNKEVENANELRNLEKEIELLEIEAELL
ncbi:HK97 family phage prohead protease [Clostridium perfringens]|uniref:HK97 family phage prohead protease n=1 Tax=Clostridium perfringens TaxID=1502 RepID=UPI0013E2B3A0|nr:HK97 family phage prohead protease [Clostridium perfringens]MCR1963950.1 HK97 family phage prohead protease [Clostridium perfringens]QPR51370.1 HK97 family phage prohead protease [Clostridium perfringens]QPS27015.1 HK97 family phage prohead protease [Clostridium perfringens]UBK42115.1 HK97 family phage prohead protease [Clostridium perfringens]HAT4314970.1 HK97 family phage prohead protease [Clostridium perfringens]